MKSIGPRSREIARFLIVGGAATVVHLAVVSAIVSASGINPVKVNVLGFMVAVTLSYLLHNAWTFEAKHCVNRRSAARFLVTAIVGFLVNQCILVLGVNVLGIDFYALIIAGAAALVAVFSFVATKFWALRVSPAEAA